MIKNIVFDLCNVLAIPSERTFCKRATFALKRAEAEKVYKALMQDTAFFTSMDMGADVEEEVQKFMKKHKFEQYHDVITTVAPFVVCDYTPALIAKCKAHRQHTYLLSNLNPILDEHMKGLASLKQTLDGSVISCNVKCTKPNEEIYQILMRRYNLIPEETVFVDARQPNVNAARSVGMKAVVFNNETSPLIVKGDKPDNNAGRVYDYIMMQSESR